MIKDIEIKNYSYILPEERIAKFPLENRDDSKLLVYKGLSNRIIQDAKFVNLAEYLPDNSIIVFNETKVVPARLLFQRETGAIIEILCLEPYSPEDYQQSFSKTDSCKWKVLVGNAKRWKGEKIHLYKGDQDELSDSITSFTVELIEKGENTSIVEFSWTTGETFSSIITKVGKLPIPPYLNRDTQSIDYQRYQTYYSKYEGSVAAPTAGLHFTRKELDDIDAKGIMRQNICLHVGAGTFLPVKSENIGEHVMHSETFIFSLHFLKYMIDNIGKPIIAVGTTSTRALESIYFIGVQCIEKGKPSYVEQWEPYREEGYDYSLVESLKAIVAYMESNNLTHLTAKTRIIIVPGYKYRVIDYLITNFHQPQSTLLLLIAALIGESWRDVYSFAMDNGYRFLSYGDSSLLQRVDLNER